MRFVLLALMVCIGGCVWPPGSDELPLLQPNEARFDVHQISYRSLGGIERLITVVKPYNNDVFTNLDDTILYIIVNGDTAYRHPIRTFPPTYDSLAPYHTDGSVNLVTLVCPFSTITDSSYETGMTASIVSPPFGDTLVRTSDILFGYRTGVDPESDVLASFSVTDSVYEYRQPIYLSSGTATVPEGKMLIFHPGQLWATMSISQTYYGYYYAPSPRYKVTVERVVTYLLQ